MQKKPEFWWKNNRYNRQNVCSHMENKTEIPIDELHRCLSNTAVDLANLFWEIPRDLQLKKNNPDEWCALEILIHLRQVTQIYEGRVKRIMKTELEELPILHDYDEKRQMAKINIEEETVKSNLSEFMKARSKLLNLVSFIDKEEWHKKIARHENLGEISLYELLLPLVKREQNNIDKIKTIFENA